MKKIWRKNLKKKFQKLKYDICFQNPLLLHTYLQETSTNFSFDRKDRILEIQQILRV
jgi:hypothetical protein